MRYNQNMVKPQYTKDQITWALEKLHNKGVKNAGREDAVKLLDTFKEFGNMVTGKIEKDKRTGLTNKITDKKKLN